MKIDEKLDHYEAMIRNLITLATSFRNQDCSAEKERCLCNRCEKLKKLKETATKIGQS